MNDSSCRSTIRPEHWGYQNTSDGDSFDMALDMRSFVDTVGINNGIIPLPLRRQFVTVANTPSLRLPFNQYIYKGNFYIDVNYPGMRPIFCFVNMNMSFTVDMFPIPSMTPDGRGIYQLCFNAIGPSLTLPTLLHYGVGGKDTAYHNTPAPCFWYASPLAMPWS